MKEGNAQTRRSALKKIALGSGIAAGAAALPSKWAKPIADRVMIPAHAQTSPPGGGGGGEQFEGGAEPKMRTLGLDPGKIAIIATIKGDTAHIQFQTQWHWRKGNYPDGKYMQSGAASILTENGTTTLAPTTTVCPPEIPDYHYEYEAFAPIPAAKSANTAGKLDKVRVKFVRQFVDCSDGSKGKHKAAIITYIKGEKLVVWIWGGEYTLRPASPATLPGLTSCCNNDG